MSFVPKARFTKHGYLRVVGGNGEERRLKLSTEEVASILDEDKAVPIGRDPKDTNKIHRAFFSKLDDECFVAVQDDTTGEVITLLPFSHHGRFVLDPAQVRKMAMEAVGEEVIPVARALADVIAGPDAHLVVSMEVERPTDPVGKTKTERLLRTPVAEGSMLHRMIEDETIRKDAEIEAMIKLNWLYPGNSRIVGFKLHFVSGGTVSEFRWFENDWTPRPRTESK